jgi:hypothetical protein
MEDRELEKKVFILNLNIDQEEEEEETTTAKKYFQIKR